jgi:adenylate kinase family enzyme
VSHEWATDKLLKRGREDDNKEEIENRLNWYYQNVVPALNFFRNDSYYKFLPINGEQTIEEVHKEILEKAEPTRND